MIMVLAMIVATETETKAQMTLNVNTGYSWVTGVVGAEVQYKYVALGCGYFPAKYPMSEEPISSLSGHLTLYNHLYGTSCYYLTVGIASAGYRYENSYGAQRSQPVTIVILGYRLVIDNIDLKVGCGYGFISNRDDGIFTPELKIGYSFSIK